MIATSSRLVFHRVEAYRLAERDPVELGIEIRGAVEADHLLQEAARFRGRDELVHEPRVAERELHLGLVDHLAEVGGLQRRYRVDDDRAGLQCREPARDHGRVVGGADQHAVSGDDAQVLDQRAGEPVGPVGKLLVGPEPPVADQRGVVAKAPLDHAIGELGADVQVFGIVEAVEQKLRPRLGRRQMIAGKRVEVSRGPKHYFPPRVCRAITTFCTSEAPS